MGMSTHIRAFTPDNDPDYQKHKKILLFCMESEVSLPPETAAYFGSNKPNHYLLDQRIEMDLKEDVHYTPWSDDSCQGFEVDLTKLPKGVTKLRFYNSW